MEREQRLPPHHVQETACRRQFTDCGRKPLPSFSQSARPVRQTLGSAQVLLSAIKEYKENPEEFISSKTQTADKKLNLFIQYDINNSSLKILNSLTLNLFKFL